MGKFIKLAAFTVVVGLMALATPVHAQTTVTSFAACTFSTPIGVWCVNALTAGGTASIANLLGVGGDLENNQPLPIGAALLTTDFNAAARAEVGVANSYGMPDDIFSTLSIMYSYHKATNAGQNLAAAPALKLPFFNGVCDDPASSGDCFGTLVYEPTWNQPGSEGSSVNVPTDVWTTVVIDKDNGLFWWTGGFGEPNTAGGPPLKTLADWKTAFSSDFDDSDLVFVSVGVGTSNQGQIGYFDDVQISHSFGGGFNKSYDFEPAPFETLGECVSTLIADNCSSESGRARATCNHAQQMACFDLFDIP